MILYVPLCQKAGHNRAKIFYMSPGSPCLLPFLYVTVSSPLTCDWLRFSRMRISAISRCAVLKFLFLYNKVMAFCLCPHCFWQHLFRALHPSADVCCWQSLRKNDFNVISQCDVFARFQTQFQHKNLRVFLPSSKKMQLSL